MNDVPQKTNQVIEEVQKLLSQAFEHLTFNPDKCIELSNEALKKAHELNNMPGVGMAHLHIGLGCSRHSNYYQALKNYLIALPIFHREEHYEGLRSVYNNIGTIYFQWNDLEKALEYYQKNLELEAYFSDFKVTSAILNNIGMAYHRLNENEKALQYCKEALNVCKQNDFSYGCSNTLVNVGKIYFTLKDTEKAEDYLQQAITANEKANNIIGLSHTYMNLSELKVSTGNYDEAIELLDKALTCANKLDDHYRTAKVYLQFATLYSQMGKVDKQKDYLEKCIALAEPNDYRSIALPAFVMLAQLSEEQADLKTALHCYKTIITLKDFLNDEKRTRSIEEIKTRMEVERTEREKEILRSKNIELEKMNEQINKQKESLEKADKELTELNQNLEIRVKEEMGKRRLQEQIIVQKSKLESLGQMAAGIAHEINQPLGLIKIASQNLFNKFDNNKITRDYLIEKFAFIEDNITRIYNFIDHIRLFSRDQKEVNEKFNVIESVDNALSMISTQCRNMNINIIKDIISENIETIGNKYRLEQVILNMLSNSKHALDSKFDEFDDSKQIIIRAYTAQNSVFIEVEDNGCGIEKTAVERVFEPFFTTKNESQGTGLGLSIGYGIISDMNGKISINSEQGKFTVVRIELPSFN